MNTSQLLWTFLVVFALFSTLPVQSNVVTRVKRQWGFGYPLFGGVGNSWEVPSNLPTYWGYNAYGGR
ncbi:hypothetical protein B9Z55_006369 [Caenorhabditis nigoni]|uniref:Uncharacterized protein n=1 Tax=Caenorhabditis nigoni TaxID=1611254 RepID=A0A2G5V4X1_9PELO|nr:hypothetical protein B9Z55_006369 [Caenorhabditis nigoni]